MEQNRSTMRYYMEDQVVDLMRSYMDQVVDFCAPVSDCVKGPAPYCYNPHSISQATDVNTPNSPLPGPCRD